MRRGSLASPLALAGSVQVPAGDPPCTAGSLQCSVWQLTPSPCPKCLSPGLTSLLPGSLQPKTH